MPPYTALADVIRPALVHWVEDHPAGPQDLATALHLIIYGMEARERVAADPLRHLREVLGGNRGLPADKLGVLADAFDIPIETLLRLDLLGSTANDIERRARKVAQLAASAGGDRRQPTAHSEKLALEERRLQGLRRLLAMLAESSPAPDRRSRDPAGLPARIDPGVICIGGPRGNPTTRIFDVLTLNASPLDLQRSGRRPPWPDARLLTDTILLGAIYGGSKTENDPAFARDVVSIGSARVNIVTGMCCCTSTFAPFTTEPLDEDVRDYVGGFIDLDDRAHLERLRTGTTPYHPTVAATITARDIKHTIPELLSRFNTARFRDVFRKHGDALNPLYNSCQRGVISIARAPWSASGPGGAGAKQFALLVYGNNLEATQIGVSLLGDPGMARRPLGGVFEVNVPGGYQRWQGSAELDPSVRWLTPEYTVAEYLDRLDALSGLPGWPSDFCQMLRGLVSDFVAERGPGR